MARQVDSIRQLMSPYDSTMLQAVHIADNVLRPSWMVVGNLLGVFLVIYGAWRIRDEEIPRVALMTAAFFVGSLIHVNVGISTAHLLLNGLAGILLGRRAALAIPCALFLQAALFMHGGFTTIGINSCIMTAPALLAWGTFQALHYIPLLRHPRLRSILVVSSLFAFTLLITSFVGLLGSTAGDADQWTMKRARAVATHPVAISVAFVVALGIGWAERRFESTPEFTFGLITGCVAVVTTLVLNGLVLVIGGQEDWQKLVAVLFLAHLPIIMVESLMVAFTVAFLARVRPDMIRNVTIEDPLCTAQATG